jgi:glycosyltransferase involved in cell wall biosynthesis
MGLANKTIFAAHEWMGMPSALAAIADKYADFKTVFYAHEVATMRKIVEEHPGHDTAFYSALRYAQNNNKYLSDIFGDQSEYFKHQLVEASQNCDAICAVGDYAAKELRFLSAGFANESIEVVYNGVPAYESTYQQKIASKEKLRQYCDNLLGFKPDHIFTHVTRLVVSKGLWRDLEILENIDKEFIAQNRTAVLFVLSTEVGRKSPEQIQDMESAYGWPVAHKQGWPDLSGGETKYYTLVQRFNARSRNVKVVFINQFGFDRLSCGLNMPENMEFEDIRRGSDLEFGLSVYEPFGIAHLEALTYGGICVLTNTCGCAGFINAVTDNNPPQNIIIADYTQSDVDDSDYKTIDRKALKHLEKAKADELAKVILERLHDNNQQQIEELMKTGYELASKMSWERIITDFVMPAFNHAISQSYKKISAW